MNSIYLYDGKFSSLLALIYLLLDKKDIVIKEEKKYKYNLLDTPIFLKIENKDLKVKLLKNKVSSKLLNVVYYAFLSSDENKETIIYNFIKEAIKYKDSTIYHRNLDCVNEVLKMSSYVSREAHRMKGFLRFKKMKNNFYYAEMSPTNNIISILSNHFKKRLSKEYFIIKDVKRNIYSLYDKNKIYYLKDSDIVSLDLDLNIDEEKVVDLWKSFFNTIGIKERKNLKCQMNFMPKKYWDYIIEMENEK